MFKTHSRQKLINAVVYFASNTQRADKRKILGLLYLLDLAHLNETGQTVTGLEYAAWAHGPVPIDFFAEWDAPDDDLVQAIGHPWDRQGASVSTRMQFDPQWFSNRESRLMSQVAKTFSSVSSEEVAAATRVGPWETVWAEGAGRNQMIEYHVAISQLNPHRDELLAAAQEYAAVACRIAKPTRHRHHA